MSETWTVEAVVDDWFVRTKQPHIRDWVRDEHATRAGVLRQYNPFPEEQSVITVVLPGDETQTTTDESFQHEFALHAAKWAADTAHLSSIEEAASHPSYRRIMQMGDSVIPLILKELQVRPNQWFRALRILTGENPIKQQDAGNVRKMVDAWLEWGRKRNLL